MERIIKQILFLIPLCLFLLFAYLKYYEKRAIYYPVKQIKFTPEDFWMEYEEVFFTTEDKLKLHGWFIPAKNSRRTVLFCHGNAGNISHRVEIVRLFHRIGLDVFIFDYRGYGKSQGGPSEEGLYQDARAAYRYLVDKRGVQPDNLIIYGKSIGANVAVDLASRYPPAALISDSAFTSARDMAKRIFPFLPTDWVISIQYDALSKIEHISCPKLFIHSRDDEVVPFEQGRRLYEAAPEPKTFYQSCGGHNDSLLNPAQQTEFMTQITSFLKIE